jgi:hypothetical protein
MRRECNLSSSSSSSSSDSGGDVDKDKDNSSDQDSLNSELLQEQQFQAEMDRYDFVMAWAREIVERRRREEVEDNDIQSDSELSVLASSLFDGIGMEMDIDNVELGDIGGGVQSDGNGNGNGDGDSNSNSSGNDSGDGDGEGDGIHHHQNQDVMSAIVSPRRTRSGKVIKYSRNAGW